MTTGFGKLSNHLKLTLSMFAAILIVTAVVVGGCAPGDEHGVMQGLTSEQQSQKMIDTINSNKEMPQAAKDSAIGAIKAHAGTGAMPGAKK